MIGSIFGDPTHIKYDFCFLCSLLSPSVMFHHTETLNAVHMNTPNYCRQHNLPMNTFLISGPTIDRRFVRSPNYYCVSFGLIVESLRFIMIRYFLSFMFHQTETLNVVHMNTLKYRRQHNLPRSTFLISDPTIDRRFVRSPNDYFVFFLFKLLNP
ncbi:hypothetical protein Hanom_Chr12g01108721 [Helianthus anomalus]